MAKGPALPRTGYIRLHDIIGRPARGDRPAIEPLIPVSKSTWFAGVQSGRFPAPTFAFGPNIAAYRVSDIRALLDQASRKGGAAGSVMQAKMEKSRKPCGRKLGQDGPNG